MDYDHISHSKILLVFHIVLVTKYRHKILGQLRIRDTMKLAEAKSEFVILEQEFEPDHIHLLLKIKPNHSVSSVVNRIKMVSTNILWKTNGSLLRKLFWKKRTLWSSGYFACTIGNASMETIRKYIQTQG